MGSEQARKLAIEAGYAFGAGKPLPKPFGHRCDPDPALEAVEDFDPLTGPMEDPALGRDRQPTPARATILPTIKPITAKLIDKMTDEEFDRIFAIAMQLYGGKLASHDPAKHAIVSSEFARLPRSTTTVTLRRTIEIEIEVEVAIDVDDDDDGCGSPSASGNSQTGSRGTVVSLVGTAFTPDDACAAVRDALKDDEDGIREAAEADYRENGRSE